MAGYSQTPLLKKLGYREGQRALQIAVPGHLRELDAFDGFARQIILRDLYRRLPEGPFDLIHVFETERAALEVFLAALRARLDDAGALWVSWPKKTARVPTTLDENAVRAFALANGLVDVKACAVDAVWSGLKLVVPRARRREA